MKLRPIKNTIIVSEMNFDERITASGLIIPSDDKKSSGIRPRWGKVWAVGPEQKDVKVGQYVLVAHGRWTRGVKFNGEIVRKIDNKDILLVSDEPQLDETFNDLD